MNHMFPGQTCAGPFTFEDEPMKAPFLAGALLAFAAVSSHAAPIFTEGFDNVGSLAVSGWVLTNNSSPIGSTGWFQGNTGIFDAASGAANSYVAANFENAAAGGAISNWLISPTLTFSGPVALDFALRMNADLTDTVEVYFSSAGAASSVGSTTTSTETFSLLTSFSASSGDTGWLNQSVTFGSGGANSGRFAFRYVVGDTFAAGDYIGIDSVSVSAVPEPTSALLMALGVAGLAAVRRRRSA